MIVYDVYTILYFINSVCLLLTDLYMDVGVVIYIGVYIITVVIK